MIPAAPAPIAAVRPPHPVAAQTAQKTTQALETTRASAGEAGSSAVRSETVDAAKAAEQSTVAPRLRDQERSESSDRRLAWRDAPAGPPPAFEESPLERQARVALDPPDEMAAQPVKVPVAETSEEPSVDEVPPRPAPERVDPPPTPTERAEASFSETRALSSPRDRATVDVRN
jgi:hypothetical protein